MSDLVKRILAGDRKAHEQLFDSYGEAIYACALGTTLDTGYAAHACQKLFVHLGKIIKHEDASEADLRNLLFRALHAEIVHSAAKRPPRSTVENLLAPVSVTLPESYIARVEDMLRRLNESDRELLVLKVMGRFSSAEIARIVAVAPEELERRYRDAIGHAKGVLFAPQGEIDDPEVWLGRVKFRSKAKLLKASITDTLPIAAMPVMPEMPVKRRRNKTLVVLIMVAALIVWIAAVSLRLI
jgi:DNA-directed RNA polymerase specialized sigma24 family protein